MTANETENTLEIKEGRILRPFLVESFSLRADRCLNGWHRGAACSRCADSCPVTAITLDDGNVNVNDACVNCGVCLRACPTEVFVEISPPEAYLSQPVTHPHKDVWELACPLTSEKKDSFSSQLPQAKRMIAPRCLGAIGPAHLLEMSDQGNGQVWLNDAACGDCIISQAHQQIEKNVMEANGWLTAYGRAPAIFLTNQDLAADAPPPQTQPAFRVERPHPRRAFLRNTLKLDRQLTAVTASYTPRDRQRLLPILASLKPTLDQISLAGLNVVNVQVNDQVCSACNLCGRHCPTGALQFLADAEIFGLLFTAGSCVDCGICAMICPESAVTLTNSIPPEELVATTPRRLALDSLKQCPTCPLRIAENSVHKQCHICRQDKRPSFLKT